VKNKDIYEKDIDTFSLENQGVAKVDEALDEQQQHTLRFELETFVCKGHYEEGLKRILENYVATLNRGSEAPAAWVSGFFGSGKSHLVKMLRALWTNKAFSDGRTPRDIARLPSSVSDALKELDLNARQKKTKLLAASGTLSQGESDSIRKSVLAIVFKAAGLPSNYSEATALMWLRNEGIEDAVRQTLSDKKRSLERELNNLAVSTHLHEAILKAKPELASDSHALGDRLEKQFLSKEDISQDDFLRTFKEATYQNDVAPIFLLVLDELQQYIADNAERAIRVQDVIESLSGNMDGRVLVVATGQAALADTKNLQKLMGRFSVPVLLSTSDVEEVLRETVLKKKPSATKELTDLFSPSRSLGEVSSHLRQSTFQHTREDEKVLGASYPILPTRQRLWERVLGSTDTTGTGIQLRSQLRLAFEAVKTTSQKKVGAIVGGDFIYDEIRQRLRQSNQISAEIADSIDGLLRDGHELKARCLKSVFLLSRVISSAAADTGLKTDAQSIADLLVDDLNADNSALRANVKQALEELVDVQRKLMRVSNAASGIEEYRLQTKESAEWFSYCVNEEIGLRNDPTGYESKLREELSANATEVIRKISIQQGVSKQVRRLVLHTDPVSSPREVDGLAVWLRSDIDGTRAKEVESDATRAGLNSSITFVHVGLTQKDELVKSLITREAAKRTLDHFGQPNTAEGQEARNALVKQQTNAGERVTELLTAAISNAQVYQGGGQSVEDGASLDDRIKKSAIDGAARLYAQFALTDVAGWQNAYQDAARGLVNALEKVGFTNAADSHPGAVEILSYIASGSHKGAKLKERFTSAPYGWNNEAVLALLAVMFSSGQLKITTPAGQPLAPGKFLERDVNQYSIERENTPLSTEEKRVIARLTKCKPDEAEIAAPKFVEELKHTFALTTGEPPRPASGLPALLDELDKLSGKELVKKIASQETDVVNLKTEIEKQHSLIQERNPLWITLESLNSFLAEQPNEEVERIGKERQAILDQRQLLSSPDPITPLINSASDLLRSTLNQSFASYETQFTQGVQSLKAQADWQRLSESDQLSILQQFGLAIVEGAPTVGTTEELIKALKVCTPGRWDERGQAVAGKVQQAASACAKKLEPTVQPYQAPSRMVRNEAELEAWLSEVGTAVKAKLKSGPVQL